jgi:membrane protein
VSDDPLCVSFTLQLEKGLIPRIMKKDEKQEPDVPDSLAKLLLLMDPDNYAGFRRHLVRWFRNSGFVVRDFIDDRCLLRASALSFTTILSIVPFFALAFAVLKGLGVHMSLEPFIIDKLAAGSPEIVERIITYIDNTKMGSVGAVGLAALIVTVVTLMGNIEEAFNGIWGVRETRSYSRKFSDYISVVVIGPVLLLAATSVTTSLQSQAMVRWLLDTAYIGDFFLFLFNLIPFLSIWVVLIFLYIFIPNTRVRFKSALVGGLLAGTFWQFAQWGYIHFQVGVAKYNAIYGTLSALPVFMVWIYTSWLIVLFGVEVVYAHQNRRTFQHDLRLPSINHATKEMTALLILLATVEAYFEDKTPWTCERLAERLGIPLRIVHEILQLLIDRHYLVAAKGENTLYYPARAPEHMYLQVILEDLRNYGGSYRITGMGEHQEALQKLMARMKPGAAADFAGLTVKDIIFPT